MIEVLDAVNWVGVLGWMAAICAMAIPIPQILMPGKVSKLTFWLCVVTHLGYGSLGLIHAHYWMTMASSWGLCMSMLVIWRVSKRQKEMDKAIARWEAKWEIDT